ncbi:MAG: molybdopterin converting factor subunit 1 [Rhodospirillales bacterium]
MKVLYFAWMREKVGHGKDTFDSVPDGVSTVGDLIAYLAGLQGGYAAAFADQSVVRAAVNQTYVELSHPVADGDEVAFFPPVTGG